TPLPTKRTANACGDLMVAEVAVTANCPVTLFVFTTRHASALLSALDVSASASTQSAPAAMNPLIPASPTYTCQSHPQRADPEARGLQTEVKVQWVLRLICPASKAHARSRSRS